VERHGDDRGIANDESIASISGTMVLRWLESVAAVIAIVFGIATLAQPILVLDGSGADPAVIVIFLLAMAALRAIRATDTLVQRRLRDTGVPARATVVEIADCDRDDSYWVDVTYRYRARGIIHSGHRQFDRLTQRRWHPGDRIRVVYDPRWPSVSAWIQSARAGEHRKTPVADHSVQAMATRR
jgi:hypothetical protein